MASSSRWFETTIGEQATLQRGVDITRKEQRPGSVPVISSGGIGSYHDTAYREGPGVVLGRKGVVGSVWFIDQPYWPHDTTLWVKDFHGNNERYVYYFFKSIASQLAKLDVGSANPTLNRNHVHPIRIAWPHPDEQKPIASILGALDDKIELNRRMNATLEATARAIFKSWFVDFDPVRAKMDGRQPAGMSADLAALFPDSLEHVDGELVPKGWKAATIDDATSLIIDYRGKTPKKLGADWARAGTPAISAKNVKNGRLVRPETFKFVDDLLYSKWMKDELRLGDIVMTSEAPLGELYYLASNAKYCLSQRLFAIRVDKSVCSPTYLYYWLASPEVQAELESRATGTTVVGIRQSELRLVRVLLPPAYVRDIAATHFEAALAKMHSNDAESVTLTSMRDTLLPKLLSGELRVRDAGRAVEEVV